MASFKGLQRPAFLRDMNPKKRQYMVLAALVVLFFATAFIVTSMVGGPEPAGGGTVADATKVPPRGLSTAPGSTITDKDAWIGTAAKDVEMMKRMQLEDRQRQANLNQQMTSQLEELQNRSIRSLGGAGQPGAMPPAPTTGGSAPAASGLPPAVPPGAANLPSAFPPGQPMQGGGARAQPPEVPIGIARVSMSPSSALPIQTGAPGAPGAIPPAAPSGSPPPGDATKTAPRIGNTLPISFARAILLTGVDAATGSIAPKNPLPVMLRIEDLAVLPNRFRADIKECFVVGAAHGDLPAERAFIRGERMSCVTKRGEIVEVPVTATVYGEDGKAGLRGRLIEKQGALLANALLAGIASGIGQGFAQQNQVLSISPLGTTATTPTSKIFENALASGVGKSMDRLAQFYIEAAQRMYPIIEIDSGRTVDIGFLQAVSFSSALPASSAAEAAAVRTADRGPLMRAVNNAENDDDE